MAPRIAPRPSLPKLSPKAEAPKSGSGGKITDQTKRPTLKIDTNAKRPDVEFKSGPVGKGDPETSGFDGDFKGGPGGKITDQTKRPTLEIDPNAKRPDIGFKSGPVGKGDPEDHGFEARLTPGSRLRPSDEVKGGSTIKNDTARKATDDTFSI